MNTYSGISHRHQSKRVLDKMGGMLMGIAVIKGMPCLIGEPCSDFTVSTIVANAVMALLILIFND